MKGKIKVAGSEWVALINTEGMDLDVDFYVAHGSLRGQHDEPIGVPEKCIARDSLIEIRGRMVADTEPGVYELHYCGKAVVMDGTEPRKGWLRSLSLGPRLEEAP